MVGKRQRANGTLEYVFKKAGILEKPILSGTVALRELENYFAEKSNVIVRDDDLIFP